MANCRFTWIARGLQCLVAIAVVFLRCDSARADLAVRGLWNGYLNQQNVVECLNAQLSTASVELELLGPSGERLHVVTADILGMGSHHFILPQAVITDRYGSYLVRVASGSDSLDVYCFTALYRRNSGGALEYAYALPPVVAQRGAVAGMFNSMNPTGAVSPTVNWLSIVNLSERVFRGRLELVANGVGGMAPSIPFAIAPRGRRDLALGHPFGQLVGIYRIVPDDADQPYFGQLMRFGVDGANYQFAFPLAASAGSCDSGPIPISTMAQATNWVEIANAGALATQVAIEIRGESGALIESRQVTIGAFEQYHLHVNPLLGRLRTGSARVRCVAGAGALLTQSMFYGIGPDSQLRWAYAASPVENRRGCGSVFATNTYLGAANWVKAISGANSETLDLSLLNSAGQLIRSGAVGDVPAGGNIDLGLHELSGWNFTGQASIVPGADRGISLSMIRVFPEAGDIGTIMAVPEFSRSCPDGIDADFARRPDAWGEILSHREFRRTPAKAARPGDTAVTLTDYMGAPIDIVVRVPVLDANSPTIVVEAPGAPGYSAYAAIAAALAEARRVGASRIVFPPGEYRVVPGTAKQHLDLSNLHDVSITGVGATLVFTEPRRPGVVISDSSRVQIDGLALDWEYQNSVAVEIVGNDSYRELRTVSGEAINPSEYDAVYTFDTTTGRWQAYVDGQRALFHDGAVLSEVSPGIYTHPLLRAISPGRSGVLMRTRVGKALTVDIRGISTEDITLQNISFWNTPQMSVYASGVRGLRIANCRIERSRRAPQLISGRADGFHVGGARGDVIIENNVVDGQGDDGINIRGIDFQVSALFPAEQGILLEANSSFVGNRAREFDTFESGDLLAFLSFDQRPLAVLRVERATRLSLTKLLLTIRRNTFQELGSELAKLESGMRGVNLSKSSSRHLIRNNQFSNNAGRGMLLCAPNGLVTDNEIRESRFSGMLVATFNGAFFEAPGASNVTIARNYFARTNNVGGERDKPAGAITVYVEERKARATFPLLQRLSIQDNLIEDVQGLAIQVSHARKLRILQNTIDHANTQPFKPPIPSDTTVPRGSLMVEHSSQVRISGNVRDATSGELFVDGDSNSEVTAQSDY